MATTTTTQGNKQKRGIPVVFLPAHKPSSGRHLKPESSPQVAMADKTHVLRNWFSSARKKKPRGDHHVETKFDGGGGGGREGVVVAVEAARKSVSHVETNLVSVAAFLQVKVLVSDMPGFMQVHAFRSARRTYDSLDKFSPKHMAYNLKKEFDKMYGPAWHCIVGSGFGSFVTHSTGCFLYFSMEKLCILLFRTKIQKAGD